jgi:hypothetical protein
LHFAFCNTPFMTVIAILRIVRMTRDTGGAA